jgi:hypothetical protein
VLQCFSQVHKVHINIQRNDLGNSTWLEQNRSGAAYGAPDIVRCASNTVRCPGWSTPRTGRSRVFLRARPLKFIGLSGAPPDCPVIQWSNGQLSPTVDYATARAVCSTRSQKTFCDDRSYQTIRCATGLFGATRRQKTSTIKTSKPQRSADVALTGRWTMQCPVHHRTVRCAHRQQRLE